MPKLIDPWFDAEFYGNATEMHHNYQKIMVLPARAVKGIRDGL